MNELSLYILDITQNSFNADSTLVYISINYEDGYLIFEIKDNGTGMNEETIKKALTPFYTSRKTRKNGFGLPFLKELVDLCLGKLEIESEVGKGTNLKASFKLDSIDMMPLGNIIDTMYTIITNPTNCDIVFSIKKDNKGFSFDTREIKKILDGISLIEPDIMVWFKGYMNQGLESLN